MSLLARLFWLIVAAGAVVVGLMFSLLLLAGLLVLGAAGYAYLRWRTRHLRRDLHDALRSEAASRDRAHAASGVIIEGEVVGTTECEQGGPSVAPRIGRDDNGVR